MRHVRVVTGLLGQAHKRPLPQLEDHLAVAVHRPVPGDEVLVGHRRVELHQVGVSRIGPVLRQLLRHVRLARSGRAEQDERLAPLHQPGHALQPFQGQVKVRRQILSGRLQARLASGGGVGDQGRDDGAVIGQVGDVLVGRQPCGQGIGQVDEVDALGPTPGNRPPQTCRQGGVGIPLTPTGDLPDVHQSIGGGDDQIAGRHHPQERVVLVDFLPLVVRRPVGESGLHSAGDRVPVSPFGHLLKHRRGQGDEAVTYPRRHEVLALHAGTSHKPGPCGYRRLRIPPLLQGG